MLQNNHKAGVTLLEVMLVVAALTILMAIVIPSYRLLHIRTDMEVAMTTIVQMLRRAHVLAQGVHHDSSWGVRVATGSVTLFKGTSYTSRDTAFDEVEPLPSHITVSGVAEISYTAFFGRPQTIGTITLTSLEHDTRSIVINSMGLVSY